MNKTDIIDYSLARIIPAQTSQLITPEAHQEVNVKIIQEMLGKDDDLAQDADFTTIDPLAKKYVNPAKVEGRYLKKNDKATDAEIDDGTNNEKFITPAGLAHALEDFDPGTGTGAEIDDTAPFGDKVYSSNKTQDLVDDLEGSLKGGVPTAGDTLKELYDAIQGLGNLSAEDIDTLAELNTILADADLISVASIVNNLTSSATNAPLSAAQGKVLKDLIDSLRATRYINFFPKLVATTAITLTVRPIQGNATPENVLLTAQPSNADNGFYGWNGSAYVRFTSADLGFPEKTIDEVLANATFVCQSGDNAGSSFYLNTTVSAYQFLKVGGGTDVVESGNFTIDTELLNGQLQFKVYFKNACTLTLTKRESTIATLAYSTDNGSTFTTLATGTISAAIPADNHTIFQVTYVTPTSTSRGVIYLEGNEN